MRVVYEGPAEAVSVPEAGGRAFTRGVPGEVPAAIGRRLITQEFWRAVKPRRRRSETIKDKEVPRG